MSNTQLDTEKLKTKPGALNELLRTHFGVYLHLDSRKQNVVVPSHLRKAHLVLMLGLNLEPTPIRDLKIDEKGWSATLTFDRRPATVFVPWPAVFAIVGDSGYGNVWSSDIPEEVKGPKREATLPEGKVAVHRDPEKHSKLPPGWGVVDGGKKTK